MIYADEDNEMSLYEKDDLRNWQGKNMPIYKCKKCGKNYLTSNIKTALTKYCPLCKGKLIEVSK